VLPLSVGANVCAVMPVLVLLPPTRLIALLTVVSVGGADHPLARSWVKILLLAFAQMPKYKLAHRGGAAGHSRCGISAGISCSDSSIEKKIACGYGITSRSAALTPSTLV
jgi:hypothetical protein